MGNEKSDRLFIEKYDNFVFTVRKMIYFGDTSKSMQPSNPKHDRARFINYFAYDTGEEFYDSLINEFKFENDKKLKEEFSTLYTYKALGIQEMGDYFQIFSKLNSKNKYTGEEICNLRSLKNINRRLEPGSELATSGSISVSGANPRYYQSNVDITDGLSEKQKNDFLNGLDFAIKKRNFSTFAATYKKMVECRDNIELKTAPIEIDHQLFHPILDELHIWEVITALTENLYINIDYCKPYPNVTETNKINNLIPLKIIYDVLYGRTYLFAYHPETDKIYTLRFDKIFHIEKLNAPKDIDISLKKAEFEEKLKTAWLVNISNSEIKHVKIEFKNTPAIRSRVANEKRHGKITEIKENSFIYEIDVNDTSEMKSWVLSFGSSCCVKSPQEFVDNIIGTLKEIIK